MLVLSTASTLNVLVNTEFMGVSFGCNRRKTSEETQTSKEKATKEVSEKKKSSLTHLGWQATGNSGDVHNYSFS